MEFPRTLLVCCLLAGPAVGDIHEACLEGDGSCPAAVKGDSMLQHSGSVMRKSSRLSVAAQSSSVPAAVKVAPGNPGQLSSKPLQCGLTANERHSVRCCSDTVKVKMWEYGCTGGCDLCRRATYLEAVDICESSGYRLCTVGEALGPDPMSCTTSQWCNTGCAMNGDMFWTSSACSAACPASPARNFQPWSQLDYGFTAQCDANDPHHCYGNGDCICGTCVCRLGWRGPYCSQLDLLPAQKGAAGIEMDSSNPTWGGAGVVENGRFKFLAGGKRLKASEATFDPRTRWGRAPAYDETAANPYGSDDPYAYTVDATKNPFTDHNYKEADPAKQKYDDGSYLTLYESQTASIGGPFQEKVPKFLKTFRADLKTSPSGSLLLLGNMGGGFVILESASGSIMGPWKDLNGDDIESEWAGGTPGVEPTSSTNLPPPVYRFADNGHCRKVGGVYKTGRGSALRDCTAAEKEHWACDLKDPSFAVHPNGTAVIMFRGTKCSHTDHVERLGILVSTTGWQGPFTMDANHVLDDTQVQDGGLEDLFMWIDQRGTHLVVHSQAKDHSYTPAEQKSFTDHKKKRGAYLFSADGRVRWSLSDWELFPSDIRWDDGTTQYLLKQQRPSIVFDKLMQPLYLVTGVDFLYDPCCDWYPFGSGWTLMQPIQQACPVGEVSSGTSCTACSEDSSEYNGRCLHATTKYNECACAECQDGFKGDRCEVPVPTCAQFQPGKLCFDMSASAKFFPKQVVDDDECLATCQAHARSIDAEGCCFQYDVANNNRNCRFIAAEMQVKSVNSQEKMAAICSRR